MVALFAAVAAAQQETAVDRLLGELERTPALEKNLRVLCDEIGGRIPGSPAMARAVKWAVEAFRAAGLERVETETFTIPSSWAEGDTRIEVVEPARFRVRAAAVGWSPAGPGGGLEAEILDAGEGEDGRITRLGRDARGKILLLRSQTIATLQDLAVSQRRAMVAAREAAQAGAVAVLLMSTRPRNLLYRHTNVIDGRLDRLPAAVLSRDDALRILRLIESGRRVRMRLDLPNRTGGPVEAENVVAEIRGREKPEEVVILGAHLDSWDLGTGCLDNGCNAAMIVEVARALRAAPAPRRTVRFVLFGAEEQGLLGSRAYVERHRAELDNVVAAIVHDIGTGRISGYSLGGRKELEPVLTQALAPVASRGATTHTGDAFFGSDHFDFLLQGIPAFVANQDTTDYIPNYHAESDTFDKVDLEELRRQAAIAAAAVYHIADRPARMGKRLKRAEIQSLLKETALDDQLKLLGIWEDWTAGRRGRR